MLIISLKVLHIGQIFDNRIKVYVSYKDSNHPFEPNGLTKGKWYLIEVEQKFVQMEYHYIIKINGETVRDMINNNPQEFIDMQVYAAKPWDNSAEQG